MAMYKMADTRARTAKRLIHEPEPTIHSVLGGASSSHS